MADDKQSFSALNGIDPYIYWIWGPGRRHFFPPGRQSAREEQIPVLVRLKKGTAQDFAAGAHLQEFAQSEWRQSVSVSPLFTQSAEGDAAGPYLVATFQADYLFRTLSDQPLQASLTGAVESMTPGLPLDPASLPVPGTTATASRFAPEPPSSRPRVVTAVIDDGIGFAHERFRRTTQNGTETRVAYWWLQDGAFSGPTSTVPFGRELNKQQIDGLLKSCTRGNAIDEDLFYRKAGLVDFRQHGHKSVAHRTSHGTAVMDHAGGYDPARAPQDRPLIAVQLPIRVTADTSGASLYPWVVMAFAYILNRATALSGGPSAPQLPVVINLSYGRLEGPHDGTSDLELAIERFIQHSAARGVHLRVVLPAGNSHLTRTHARIDFRSKGQCEVLPWRVLPDDHTPSFAEIWLPLRRAGSPANRIEVKITSPTGQSRTISETSGPVEWAHNGQVYGQAVYSITLPSHRGMFRISLVPTAHLDDPAAPLSPSGTWKLELNDVDAGQSVNAWIQRDDTLYGFPLRGRQSFFDDPRYVRFDRIGRPLEVDAGDSPVKREGTINAIATGNATATKYSPLVAGAHLRKEMRAAIYSAAGARARPPRWPDAMAPSNDSEVHGGILAAGSFSGSRVLMNGTSVAAPQIARLVADDLAAGGPGDGAMIQARAAADEAAYPPGTLPQPPAERSGAGRLNLPPTWRARRYEK
jgi:hypothetical protein